MAIEFAEKLRRIPVYPAADGYASEGPVAKLASNESPYPPIPAVIEAVTKALTGLNRYPAPTNAALRKRLSEIHGVPAQRIAIGNGSCDILLAAGDALLEPGAELVYAWPSFRVYPHLPRAPLSRPPRIGGGPGAGGPSGPRSPPATITSSTRWPRRSRPPRGSCSS